MSIFDQTGQVRSVTEESVAFAFFMNRDHIVRRFAEYLNADPAPNTILFLTGDGGNGKSLLLTVLRQQCCKRFTSPVWNGFRKLDNQTLARRVKEGPGEAIPTAFVDFGTTSHQYQGMFSALQDLRHKLLGVRFPLYDFACLWYWYRRGELTEEKRRSLPMDEMGAISDIANVLTSVPVVSAAKSVIGVFNRRFGAQAAMYLAKRGINEATIRAIQAKELESALIADLPVLFAQDLNAAVAEHDHERIVLFFDTHEALRRTKDDRDASGDPMGARDEWLRCLLGNLHLQRGVVVVVASRDHPQWSEVGNWRIPDAYIEEMSVEHLRKEDALKYLKRVHR